MRRNLFALAFLTFAGATGVIHADIAYADEASASKMPEAGVKADGWYVSGDVAWQAVNLPDYGLGFRKVTNPIFSDGGTFQSLDQHLDGYRLQGTVGYFLPPALSDTLMGANTRVEFVGRYGRATGGETGIVDFTDGGVARLMLDGTGANAGYVCSIGQVCHVASNVSAEHSDWQIGGRIAGEYRVDQILLTPSLTLFGGETRTDQAMAQVLQLGAHPELSFYTADTSLRSTDYGLRAGVDLKFDVTPVVSLGLGGSAGLARRHTSFDGTDIINDTLFGILTGTGTASGSDNATPFVANTEVSLTYKWLPALAMRGFAGVDYDSKVAGIAAPDFGGVVGGVTTRTPARVSFHSELGFYAGGGITWSF
ncbi:MAG: hypothetical protein Q7T44_02525 [Parvibaculum sp.]|nr:hypothetical protein [Parvibaculum sp.]